MEGILFLLFVDIYRCTMNITLIIPPKLKQLTGHLGLYLYFFAKTGAWFCFKRKMTSAGLPKHNETIRNIQ